jgi:hypothetical protein
MTARIISQVFDFIRIKWRARLDSNQLPPA